MTSQVARGHRTAAYDAPQDCPISRVQVTHHYASRIEPRSTRSPRAPTRRCGPEKRIVTAQHTGALGPPQRACDNGSELIKERVHDRIPVVIWAELPGARELHAAARPSRMTAVSGGSRQGRACLDGRDRRDTVVCAGSSPSLSPVLENSSSTDPIALGERVNRWKRMSPRPRHSSTRLFMRESADTSRRHADGWDKGGSPRNGPSGDIRDRISRRARAPDRKPCSEDGTRGCSAKLMKAESWGAPVLLRRTARHWGTRFEGTTGGARQEIGRRPSSPPAVRI